MPWRNQNRATFLFIKDINDEENFQMKLQKSEVITYLIYVLNLLLFDFDFDFIINYIYIYKY